MKILFYDLETTGTEHQKHGIHQVSGIIEINNEVVDEFDFKVSPAARCEIEQSALDLRGLKPEIIKAYPEMHIIFAEFTSRIEKRIDKYSKSDKFFLAGYNNASFDNHFLRAWFGDNFHRYFGAYFWSNSIDAMVLATEKLKVVRAQMPNFKLHTVAKQLGIEVDESKLHDALYDVHLTREVYKKCINLNG